MRGKVDPARWILLELPHRRMQPKSSKKGPRTAVPFEQRHPILQFIQPLQNLLLKFVVHYPHALQTSSLRKILGQGHFLRSFWAVAAAMSALYKALEIEGKQPRSHLSR